MMQRYNFRHISRTQTGPKLSHMRQLYAAKVLPIFAYACGAWYIPRGECTNYALNAGYMERLEQINNDCVFDVSGAMWGTNSEILLKELHVHRISIFLEKTAISQRARELDTPQHAEMCRIRAEAWSGKRSNPENSHPYHQCDNSARGVLDGAPEPRAGNGNPSRRNHVKRVTDERAEEASRAAWEDHKVTFISKRSTRIPAAYSDPRGWGPHNPERYANLPRHQSSLLLQCRVEVVAVKATLYRMRAEKNSEDRTRDTPCCPCGYPQQTIEHLFSYCPDLEEARARELVLRLGTKHVDELLARYPAEASAFAVRHFNICKDKDAEVYLPRRGGEEEKSSVNPARGKEQQQQQRHGHGHGQNESGKGVKKTKNQRRTDYAQKMWKKRRREAVEGPLHGTASPNIIHHD